MTRLRILLVAMLVVAVAPSAAAGQTAAPKTAPTPCVNDPERHRFDFWIGEWDVANKAGAPQGRSVIQSVSGGCAILENWTSLNGGNGKSLNAYNPEIRQWQQYWIGQDGQVSEFRGSEFDGTSLTFLSRDVAQPLSIGRLTFTPVDKATVRQHAEKSTDGGKSWTTTYDLYYHRKAT